MNAIIEFEQSKKIFEPGLVGLGLGRERFRVPAGGVVAFPVCQGDKIQVTDPQGMQHACVVGFDDKGNCLTEALGIPGNSNAEAIHQTLLKGDNSASRLSAKLKAFHIDLSTATSALLLSGETPAGNSVCFTSEKDLLCLVAAPGEQMSLLTPQLPTTELIVNITRASIHSLPEFALPEPLADPLSETRIDARTAVAYEVKAGEFIQIVDVAGRQCSDFQCFDRAHLDEGVERCLDATSTRSMMGSAYPGPGLHSKFYDVELSPMVEIIQDSCGRHDSFGLACTAKYYEEAGYPGHINCSDNFNRAIANYPIKPRKGWMAMNLFFNTFFDDNYQFFFDDPWSRPGDYVLMRALRDLVCLSSACPCDIDPANGWQPTDVHLRIYPEKNMFKRSIAFRKSTDAEPIMTQETGFHPRTSALTRNFIEYNGYWLANSFNNYGAISEYWACRKGVIMTDLSPLRKYEVVGPDAELLMQTCVTRDIRKLSVGQVVYTAMCYPNGGMIDDGTVFRLCKDNFRWIGGCDSSGQWLREQAKELNLRAWVKDSTAELANLQVQGPKSLEVLKQLVWTRPDQSSMEELAWFRFSIARIGDDQGIPILVSRTGYTGELGYEVFCHPSDAPAVWDTIWEAGQEFEITPLGLEALDILRIEAGLVFANYEFSDQTDPFEAGIGFTVPLKSKLDDFIGKDSLVKRKTNPQRKLVGLELNGGEAAGNGDGVYIGRNKVGQITSGTNSPVLGKNIALCHMSVEYSKAGTEIEIGKLDGFQKRIPAIVVSFPHFDPKKLRVRGNYEGSIPD